MPFPNPDSQFRPGTSGNPRGRPKGSSLGSVLRDVLGEEAKLKDRKPGHGITNRELLIRQLFDEAVKTKDAALLRLIFDRHDGKVPESAPEADEMTDGPRQIIIPDADDRHAPDGPAS